MGRQMFNHDWFHGQAFMEQSNEARRRCAMAHFAGQEREDIEGTDEFQRFYDELDVRTLIYLRDGFSYEVREIADVPTKSHLIFECEPVDQQYKVGAFVVTVPFEEIVRVEVFAVHPSVRPADFPQITGFKASEHLEAKRPE